MNLNADLGEGAGADEAILGLVDSANVACGLHAGSASISIATAWRCVQLETGWPATITQPPATRAGRKAKKRTFWEILGQPHFVQPPASCETAMVRPAAASRPSAAQ